MKPEKGKPESGRPLKSVVIMQARRLACADFYYGMSPGRTAVVMRLTPEEADRLRKKKEYLAQFADLELEMTETAKRDGQKENDRIRMAIASLVPKAIEILNSQLDKEDLIGLQAAREILDRDGRMPKVSRVQTSLEVKPGLPEVDEAILREFSTGAVRPN